MKPNKKKPRIRNRPRNKANRLLASQEQQQQQDEEDQMPSEEIQETVENSNLPTEGVSDDDDMPDLEDDSKPPEMPSAEPDAVTTLTRIMHEKILKTPDKNSKTPTTTDKPVTETTPETSSPADQNPKGNQKAKEKVKENVAEAKTEKNAFIQNLQKKMEAMMSDGDENLPNTLMENLKKLLDQKPMTDIESSDDEEEYVEYIYKPRKYFLVGLCNLCKCDLCKIEQLIECSKCRMTYYCNIDHMQNDVEHRQLCSALQQVAANVDGGHIFSKCSDMSPDQFRSYRIIMIRKVSEILQRPLTATEQEVILFPRLCINGKCRKYEALTDCPNCGMVAYCSEPLHLVSEHEKWCKFYQLFKELVMQQEKFGRLDPSLPSKILKDTPLVCNTTREIFKKLNMDLPENSCEYAALTQISTAPLTAWYALKLTQQLNRLEELTIHLIGAEIEFEVDILHKWELFFLHITPMVKTLNVVFVGPELNPNNISFEQLQKTKCCKVCQKNQRTVKYFFEANIYHDYCRSKRFLNPNLICFFNAGLYRSTGFNMEDTWPETINAAANLNVPIVVTAYTEYESPLDLERFLEEGGREMKMLEKPSENLFSSVKPERNFISDDEAPFMFKNYYSFVLR
ncbi:uncharacterized protein LOC133333231 [Musca vetustissima]|uniref:uncharacterized protein LOC133333231 n=1 Tax=Musca vetustissima TaxID=27455 RepID=UPI002AB7E2ED|nr:uncharacterized protein LOC133333231 [Musca vetustissima]